MKILKNNNLVKFVVTLFFIGVLIGMIFFFVSRPDLSGNIGTFKELVSSTHQNTFLSSLVLISGIFVLSITVIGLPAIIFYIFYEGIAIGYTFASFIFLYHLKGGIFYLLFFVVSKLVYIVLVLYFAIQAIKYVSKFLDCFFSKNREELSRTIVIHLYRFGILFGATLLNSTIIYFLSNKIISLFINLI